MQQPTSRKTHVIFDVDGLLLDTEKFYTIANQKTLERFGHDFTWELKEMMMGRSQKDAVSLLIQRLGLSVTVDEYLMPGAERLVRHLHKHRIPMAVCTGSRRSQFILKTQNHHDFFLLFSHIVCNPDDSEVKRGKPFPDCFLVIASRFSEAPSPQNVLVFEDGKNGVEAAVNAGMQVVMVPDPRVDEEVRHKATLAIPSLLEFTPSLFSLPSFDD
ncbi:unnamed protein product [Soboliphyme baturini]|uniref:pseudouridine 5'-phosphatase n=1 Tax=Soboliphyme baturini TaxID=241478 RepID=A0A3P8BFL1_9BILA|nr:unnamed protein product [Soboliphyme baturini]